MKNKTWIQLDISKVATLEQALVLIQFLFRLHGAKGSKIDVSADTMAAYPVLNDLRVPVDVQI